MKRLTLVFVMMTVLWGRNLLAGNEYGVVFIPDSLMKESHLVVRKYETQIEVEGVDRVVVKVHRVITILNSSAKRYARLVVPYDEKLSKVNSIEARIYDKTGSLIRKIKKSDVMDLAYADDVSLFTSLRKKEVDLSTSRYPFTIEYAYQKVVRGINQVSAFRPVISRGTAIESAQLTVRIPENLELIPRVMNMDLKGNITSEDNTKTYFWKMGPRVPRKVEPSAPSFYESSPYIYLGAKEIKMGNVSGQMDSWKSFGKFFYDLNANRDELPAEVEDKVKGMIAGMNSRRKKIDTLYHYLQKNTRYVSVQLGIGGWQTYDAEYVSRNLYGDCKALTNFMKSMLGVAGIPSYATLVNAGDDIPSMPTDFVNDPFNHVILCVPMEVDTLWLECTNSSNPSGYLGTFTSDRPVLVCTPKGGILTRTPASKPEENVQNRCADVYLEESGDAKVKVRLTESGFQQRQARSVKNQLKPSDQKKWLEKAIDAPGFSITSFSIEAFDEGALPICHINYELAATNWASQTGSRIFLTPNVLEKRTRVPEAMEKRSQDLVIVYSYLDRDTIVYHLPEGFLVESAPDMPVKVSAPFGTYEINLHSPEPGKLIYTREMRMIKGRYKPEVYQEYRDFYLNVVKQDKIQVVLVNKS
jgi:transglutaminase-like putative cysteine protease